MRVAFVYIDPSYKTMGPFHIGISSLIACLRRAGYECSFFHLLGDVPTDAFAAFLQRDRPDVVAFSVTTNVMPHLPPLASLAKRQSGATTVCGGVHPTLRPDEVMAIDGIDAVCIGEGEGALLDLCRRLETNGDISDIPNLWTRDGDKVRRNPLRPLCRDLDDLPVPDREVFPYAECFDLRFLRRGVFMASRGCPYNCAYCCSPTVKQLYGGRKYIRFRSPEHLIDEVAKVTADFPEIEYNVFHDDLLPMDKVWFERFARLYRQRIALPFEMNCHPGLMDADTARMAREAGCLLVRFGIESGNEHLRRKMLSRHISDQRIIDAFRCCDDAGIQTLSYNMIGLPHETRSQVLDTVKLNARVKPRMVHVSTFYPYPGTEAYEMCRREGLLSQRHTDTYYEDSVLQQRSISSDQLRSMRGLFKPLVRLYSRCDTMPKPAGKLLEKAIDLWVLARTDRRLLRLAGRGGLQGEAKHDEPVYILKGGEVRYWGSG